jgi:hypothetical protein
MYYHSYLAFRRAMLWPKVLTEQLGLLKRRIDATSRQHRPTRHQQSQHPPARRTYQPRPTAMRMAPRGWMVVSGSWNVRKWFTLNRSVKDPRIIGRLK